MSDIFDKAGQSFLIDVCKFIATILNPKAFTMNAVCV